MSTPPGAAADALPGRPWLPYTLIGGVIVAVGAIATVVLLLVGGSPDTERSPKAANAAQLTAVTLSAQNVYTQVQRQQYYALMPAGWSTTTAPAGLKLADSISVTSAQDAQTRITVGQAQGAASLQTALAPAGGTSQVILLPGKRTARRTESATGTATQIGYAFAGCGRTYVVVGSTPTAKLNQVKARFGVVASTVQALCG